MADDSPFRALRAVFGARGAHPDLRARLSAATSAARDGDYFAVLGVAPTCSSSEARAAADALLGALDRAGDGGSLDPSVARDVRQVLVDAREVLGDDARLAAYRAALALNERGGDEDRGLVD